MLGRIAVRADVQRTGLRVGSLLLEEAVRRSQAISDLVGGGFIILDAKTSELADWYSRHGFQALKDNRLRMILPMKNVPSLLAEWAKLR